MFKLKAEAVMAILIVGALVALFILSQLYIHSRERSAAKAAIDAYKVEMVEKTEETINAIQNEADRARAMRKFCTDSGLRYNFAKVECYREADGG